MKRWPLYMVMVLLGAAACTKEVDTTTTETQKIPIEIEVVDMPSCSTRAHMFNNEDDVIALGEFGLSAYLPELNKPYFTEAWVYYFVQDDGTARWRFRDVVNQDYLINFYWPDGLVDFMAYVPRILSQCAVEVSDLEYIAAGTNKGVHFNATTPLVINDRTEAEREAVNAKHEFMFATHLNQSKTGGAANLRFVHPFAAVKFRLHQSHRDLVIHSITLHGLDMSGAFSFNGSSYERYGANNEDTAQDFLTYENWTSNNNGDMTINLEKRVPDDVNYQSQIGGPYMVLPQILKLGTKDIKLSVDYTWNDQRVQSAQFSLSTSHVDTWQPGNIYTYTLDLGDNKEEILFKVMVEEWSKGEDDGFENNYDVQ